MKLRHKFRLETLGFTQLSAGILIRRDLPESPADGHEIVYLIMHDHEPDVWRIFRGRRGRFQLWQTARSLAGALRHFQGGP